MKKTFVFVLGIFFLAGCTRDLSDDAIPWQPFDVIQLNLNLPEYIGLRTDGSSLYIPDGGVRGIIIHHQSGSNYVSYEANCSYQPNSACATVGLDPFKLYMLCSCCQSTFHLATGYPSGGPAWRPLNKYYTSVNGSTLTITDEIIP
jgi:hypothetical protein